MYLSLGSTCNKTSTPFELIFSDVWERASILYFDGFHYFIIFIDAQKKFIWFYPIVVKYGVFNVFNKF